MTPALYSLPFDTLQQSVVLAADINSAIPIVMAELQPLTSAAQYQIGINYAVQLEMLNAEWIDVVAPVLAQLLQPPQ
jgi:hypothetical protein